MAPSVAPFCSACCLLIQVSAQPRLSPDPSELPATKIADVTAQEPLEEQPEVAQTELSAARSQREDAQEQSNNSQQVSHNRYSHTRNKHCNHSMSYAAQPLSQIKSDTSSVGEPCSNTSTCCHVWNLFCLIQWLVQPLLNHWWCL